MNAQRILAVAHYIRYALATLVFLTISTFLIYTALNSHNLVIEFFFLGFASMSFVMFMDCIEDIKKESIKLYRLLR